MPNKILLPSTLLPLFIHILQLDNYFSMTKCLRSIHPFISQSIYFTSE